MFGIPISAVGHRPRFGMVQVHLADLRRYTGQTSAELMAAKLSEALQHPVIVTPSEAKYTRITKDEEEAYTEREENEVIARLQALGIRAYRL